MIAGHMSIIFVQFFCVAAVFLPITAAACQHFQAFAIKKCSRGCREASAKNGGKGFDPLPPYQTVLFAFCFVIALFGIDVPYAVAACAAGLYRGDSLEGGEHGMIHVVVPVLTVSAYAVKI